MKRRLVFALAGVAALALAATGYLLYSRWSNPDIELGPIRIGMTHEDWKTVLPAYGPFQLGDVYASADPRVTFREGKLDSFLMYFGTFKYPAFRDAIRDKYPQMRCGTIKAGELGPYEHEFCTVGRTLTITQGHQGADPTPSHLTLYSDQFLADEDRKDRLLLKAGQKQL